MLVLDFRFFLVDTHSSALQISENGIESTSYLVWRYYTWLSFASLSW